MGAFDFLKPKDGARPDEHATTPGAADAAPVSTGAPQSAPSAGAGNLAAAQSVAAGEEARAVLGTSPRARRGRPPKNPTAGEGNSGPIPSAELQAEINKATEAIFAPKAWGAVLGMPADALAAMTGRARWELSKDERETLGVTGSAVARSMAITNPKGLALLMLSSALFAAYVPRAVADLREIAAKKKAEKKDGELAPAKAPTS